MADTSDVNENAAEAMPPTLPRHILPSGAELIVNEERAIVNNVHVLVWTDKMFDKRVTVLAMIPSGTRSKNVEAYIESAADQGYGTLVLKIKTIDEWMDPNLLLICDRVHEDVPFYDDTHGLITAFRESVKASKAGASMHSRYIRISPYCTAFSRRAAVLRFRSPMLTPHCDIPNW
jgi:hypothetical protein